MLRYTLCDGLTSSLRRTSGPGTRNEIELPTCKLRPPGKNARATEGTAMALPNSYTVKPNAIRDYFEALLDAEAPDRFTVRFLENLEFKSTNDRLFIRILKDLGFLDADGVPTNRYFEFLDRSRSEIVVAEGIRDAYADLFAINTRAHELSMNDVKNKLRTLYKGSKSDIVIDRISSTFVALCEYADFAGSARPYETPEATTEERDTGQGEERTEVDPPPLQMPLVTQPHLADRSILVLCSTTSTSCFRRAAIRRCTTRSSRA